VNNVYIFYDFLIRLLNNLLFLWWRVTGTQTQHQQEPVQRQN